MKKERDMIRSQEVINRYREAKKGRKDLGSFVFDLEQEQIIKEFKYWVIIAAAFPYDVVLQRHNMLVPKRFFSLSVEMSIKEREELEQIKESLGDEYDGVFENLKHKRSVPAHFHIHLFLWKHVIDNQQEK